MKRISFIVLFSLIITGLTFCEDPLPKEKLSAGKILEKVDNVINAPIDQELKVKLVLIDKKGKEKENELTMYQMGFDKRLVKFTKPAEKKDIGFLSLPDDIMYLYLPAFKKIRRIASHVKNSKFAGTDFTYEDMEAKRFSDTWIPSLKNETEEQYILELTLKEGMKSEYFKLIMYVRKDNSYPVKIEYYDKGKNLIKIQTRAKLNKVGDYWISEETTMQDLKAKHSTKMLILESKFDNKLSDDVFTKRNLER